MKRNEFKQNQDLKLVSHFCDWLTKVSEGKAITEENFESDLMDGVALCTVMQKLQGSGLVKFHATPRTAFQAKENLQFFQAGATKLALPVTFGSEDLEKQNISRIVSCLIFVAHVAHSQHVLVKEMDKEIVQKVEQMDEELTHIPEGEEEDASMPWWQALMVSFYLEVMGSHLSFVFLAHATQKRSSFVWPLFDIVRPFLD
jgi:hypothetical protein